MINQLCWTLLSQVLQFQRSHWSQFFAVQERMTYMFRNLSVSWQTGDWQVRLYTDAETWKLMGGLQSFRAKPYFLFLWHLFQMELDHMHDKNMFLVINYCWIRCCFQNIIKEACHEIWKNLMDDLSHKVRHFHMPPRLSKPYTLNPWLHATDHGIMGYNFRHLAVAPCRSCNATLVVVVVVVMGGFGLWILFHR